MRVWSEAAAGGRTLAFEDGSSGAMGNGSWTAGEQEASEDGSGALYARIVVASLALATSGTTLHAMAAFAVIGRGFADAPEARGWKHAPGR